LQVEIASSTSSGKTFIGEMAAITQAIHQKKTIYLVPLRSLAEEKYRHFKKLYGGADCKIDILVSSRDRREDDRKIMNLPCSSFLPKKRPESGRPGWPDRLMPPGQRGQLPSSPG